MRRIYRISAVLAVACLALACGPEEKGGEEVEKSTLSVSPASLSFSTYESSTLPLEVKSNGKWTASVGNGGNWCQLDARSGEGDATLHVTAAANPTTEARSTTISFTGSGNTSATVSVSQVAGQANPVQTVTTTLSAAPKTWDGTKRADITYQLLVYSFADGKGSDQYGDLDGVTQHLDYIDGLGASAIWLSPIQEASSWHSYDINDYSKISEKLGDETDFQELIDGAKAKDIDIYMDYVLNHSGTGTEWFQDIKGKGESSKYQDYYILSDDKDYSLPAFGGAGGNGGMGAWHSLGQGVGYTGRLHFYLDWTGDTKTITVTESTEEVQSSNSSASKWLWIGSVGAVGLYETTTDIFEITIDVDTDWGFLVRTSTTSWDSGYKWGGDGSAITLGTPYALNSSSAKDIVFSDESTYYFASFDQSMPDINYGTYSSASSSSAFKAIAASADKWIKMGVNGLRLDAVIWIYQKQTAANVSFLKQWYEHCNATYKSRGGSGNIYMVGESWTDSFDQMVPYYEGLPSNFNFWYWWTLKDAINNGKGNAFASSMVNWRKSINAKRSDAIDAIKLTNHDENRAGSELGQSAAKQKLAACVLLTSPGKPYIYQGEELGYWGVKSNGDEYVRAPIKWTKSGAIADGALSGKVDNSMLSSSISVEAQNESSSSILSVYKTFGKLRNTYASLASGEISEHGTYKSTSSVASIGAWYRTSGTEKLLVVHNFASSSQTVSFGTEDLSKCVGLNGSASLKTTTNKGTLTDNTLTLGSYSSAVFVISE